MSTPPHSPSAKSLTHATSPQASKRKPSRSEHPKPNESWFLILVNAFKSNFEQTLTYRESELYAWIMQEYPYYRHDMHTMQTSVKTTLSSYECFRQNGRSTWTFIPRRALVHLESLKSEDGRRGSDNSGEENEEAFDDDNDEEILDPEHGEGSLGSRYSHQQAYDNDRHHDLYVNHQDGSSARIRYVDTHIDLMDEDSPTLSVEEIQRFKQEHSGAQARKLKRKASGGHPSRPRTRSPPAGLPDECSMSMEAWCNLLVQMFEASPKQKTIREIFAWVHDNYPIYRNAPGDAWQKDLTAALESNPLFKAMGRGRWQMVTQASQPVIVLNGSMSASGGGSGSNPSVNVEDDATDSPSVTEDEDWKAIGSKRLLNFSFRRYSIATDTFPKNHYKSGTTTPANSSSQPAVQAGSSVAVTAASSTSSLSTAASGGKLLSLDHLPATYNAGRRFSSYHQPTPKNSPPLSATTIGLPTVEDFGAQLRSALSEETDDEEDPARRYMAPLQNAINSAVLALQTQQTQLDQEQPETKTPPTSSAPTSVDRAPRSGPEIVIPIGEDLASDQMDAIQALALLCGGGV